VFPVRYGLDLYILFRRNSEFKGLIIVAVLISCCGISTPLWPEYP
jgi:hypothetical protein